MPEAPIRVLLVDDSAVVRMGLTALLAQDPGLRVVGQADTSEMAFARALELAPDLVILDVRIPEAGGIEAGRRILDALPATRVLFLSAFADEELVRAAILIGAHGYLLKEIGAAPLIDSIRRVAAGDSILDPNLRAGLVDWAVRSAGAGDRGALAPLSPQEERVIALLAEGLTNREIASTLNLKPTTVKNYLHNIFEKLGIQRRSQAAALVARRELPR
jgi:two-component system, NarL family, response regulator DevR